MSIKVISMIRAFYLQQINLKSASQAWKAWFHLVIQIFQIQNLFLYLPLLIKICLELCRGNYQCTFIIIAILRPALQDSVVEPMKKSLRDCLFLPNPCKLSLDGKEMYINSENSYSDAVKNSFVQCEEKDEITYRVILGGKKCVFL